MKPLISIISILLFLSCAAQAPATGGPKDITGPSLTSVMPVDGSTYIAGDTKIIFEFDETVDPTSINSSISILGFDEYSVKSRQKKVVIEANVAWPENMLIEINMSRRIRDYQNNTMAKGYQFIFSTGGSIPEGSITGELDNYNPEKITYLLLFQWPLSEDSMAIKTIESDLDGQFEFLYLPSNKYIIFATESRSKNPSLAISKDRYGMIQNQYISIQGNQHQKIHIYMDEPIQRKKITSVNQVNPQFGLVKFNDDTESEISFSNCKNCTIIEDTLTISLDSENRLEHYSIESESFLFVEKLDTIPPILASKYWDGNKFKLHFSEPIQYSDSLNFETQIDSTWKTIAFNVIDDRDIHLSITEGNKIRFWGTHLSDLYNNKFQDSLVEISTLQKGFNEEKLVHGGVVKGKVDFSFINKITIEATNTISTESIFIHSNNGEFNFKNLEPGKYTLKAFEDKNEISSDIYFSGVWSSSKTAANYAIYADTLDVRSRWDIEGVNFKIKNLLQE